MFDSFTLSGRQVRLELLTEKHVDGLGAAATDGSELYRSSPVPTTRAEAEQYVQTATQWMDQRVAIPFVILRARDGLIIGSTRFWELEYWPWPSSHNLSNRDAPDVCEIGYTWLSPSAIRTGANLEAKLLMLTHAFEKWQVVRVCFHADARNERSIRALTGLGATREGVLRAHRLGVDHQPRNSVRFSILAEDWPAIRDRIVYRLTRVRANRA